MTTYHVTTQDELDKALEQKDDWRTTIHIESEAGVWLYVSASGSATVRAYGSATVRAYDSATVEAYDSATVEAYDSATVEAYDSATVRAYGSATVEASGSATVEAYGSATVRASKYVAIYLHSARVTHQGGVLIDVTQIDMENPEDWADYTGAAVIDGRVQLYKNVDHELMAGRDWNPVTYPIGEDVTAPDWRVDNDCGGGLHASPHPHQARSYGGHARMLLVSAPLADIRPIPGRVAKCKAQTFRVEREVTISGDPLP